jgi:UDP-N-acetylmuramoyl-tripeptide--D-alanyl-D-alanine ligase
MKIKDLYALYSKNFLVDTDTRNIRKNTLFFALKGDNFNGNKFAEEALELGASYSIVDEKEHTTSDAIILVDNVLETLQKLAKYHRNQLDIPIIGLTGSNGKTTTKELIHCVLNEKYTTTATKGNLNNHIGVPLTLLSMTPKTDIGIVEMGANHLKEIAFLCTLCEPDFGYITNFGKAHLEGFGSLEGVVKGKSELYSYLQTHHKTAFVNPNDGIQVEKTKHIKRIPFNTDELGFLEVNPFVKLSYKNNAIQSKLIGTYNYTNIAAAITIGAYFEVNPAKIKKAIESYTSTNNRSQVIKTASNKIILDAYNANPTSMKAALESFALLKELKKTVILGDMFELGENSAKEHQAIADLTRELPIENIYLVGEHFSRTHTESHLFNNFEELQNHLIKTDIKEHAILIKGSRGMQLERALEFLN